MFIASYFDRKDKENEKRKKELQNEDEYKRNHLEKMLLSKAKSNVIHTSLLKEESKNEIKQILLNFLKNHKKRHQRESTNELSQFDLELEENPSNKLLTPMKTHRENILGRETNTDIEEWLKKNKNLNNYAQSILFLRNYVSCENLKRTEIENIYEIIDRYIEKNEQMMKEIKEALEMEVEQELEKEKKKLCTIHAIKHNLVDTEITEKEHEEEEEKEEGKIDKSCERNEEENRNNIQHIIYEMKIIKKLVKERDYLMNIRNTLANLEKAKQCAMHRKYDDTLQMVLEIIKMFHTFKKNFKTQVIKGITFFLPLLKEYYLNRSKLLLSSIHWGNNISYVTMNVLEDLINDIEEDFEKILNYRKKQIEERKEKETEKDNEQDNKWKTEYKTEINVNEGFIFESNNILNNIVPNGEETKQHYTDIHWLNKQIQNAILFDETYKDLIKKESYEFISILLSLNTIEKIEHFIKDKNSNVSFFLYNSRTSMIYIDEIASSILHFFRSFFQNEKSPLFRIDKPEWGLKYLFYQCIISNCILSMFIHSFQQQIFSNSYLFKTLLLDYYLKNSYKEPNSSIEEKSLKEEIQTVGGNGSSGNSSTNLMDPNQAYHKFCEMKEQQNHVLCKITNYEGILEQLNYRIIYECKMYIRSRLFYFIQLCHSKGYEENSKKVFQNFVYHVIMIYKKWFLYDTRNCKYLLDDFFNNEFIEFLEIEDESKKEPKEPEENNNTSFLVREKMKEESLKDIKNEDPSEDTGVYVRDFFISIEKEFLTNVLKEMSNHKYCIKLKNHIILEDKDYINEYSHIFIELLKKIANRILCFQENEEFIEAYVNGVIKKLLIIVKEEFRNHWNNISDLIEESDITCLLFMSFYQISKFLQTFEYKEYLNEIIQSFSNLEKKMFHNFLDAFYLFISIRIYHLFSMNDLFQDYILTNLFKIQKSLSEPIFIDFFNKIMCKLDHSILAFVLNQATTFFHTTSVMDTFLKNTESIIQQIEESYLKTKIYFMPILQEMRNILTEDIDQLKRRIVTIKEEQGNMENKNNWLIKVTKITNALLRDDSTDNMESSNTNYEQCMEYEKYSFSLKQLKMLIARRPDIKILSNRSIVIREFIE